MKKFVLYTARFGNPGTFYIPEVSISDIDRFCFTDLNIKEGCYQRIPVRHGQYLKNDFYHIRKTNLNHLTSIRRQRFVKICIPDEIFDNYEYSVYVDCKRKSVIDFEWLLNFMESGSDFVTRRHKTRDCVYDEGRVCIEKGIDDEVTISEQLDFYKSENYPTHNGLHYSFILLRRHTKRMREFSRLWWQQLERYSFRDQISLPYVAWKHDMKISLCARVK